MAIQKKHGKGRLDKYYHLAKEKGYRARAAFKLIQLNKKYNILEKSKVLLDLCAAPGSWTQVAAATMPASSLLVAVDLSPIKPIPRAITFQSDITTPQCRATIRQHLKTWKADTVLHDGAPNVGTAWVQDAFSQAELVLQALKLGTEFLAEGGTFVSKVFRSKDYNSLLWVFNQLFTKVEATKPPSSRNVSAEIFVVCRGYKAPKRIDPRFLDPRSVFAELTDPTPNNEAKVFDPERQSKKRKREGYEEGNYTQFKETSVVDFIQTTDPIAILGSMNKLHFSQKPGDNGDIALKTIDMLPETNQEIRDCCADLKVLGKKEFRLLLRWRLKIRDRFGFSAKAKAEAERKMLGDGQKDDDDSGEMAEVESMDEEMKLQEELQEMKEKGDKQKRKERRKENEKKHKEIVRMQMNMTTPMELGMDQAAPNGEDTMFALKMTGSAGGLAKVVKGKMHSIVEAAPKDESEDDDVNAESDGEEDSLERELDSMYDQYQERKAETDAKYRAKKARKEHGKEQDEGQDFEGFSDQEQEDANDLVEDEDSDEDSDSDDAVPTNGLVTDLEEKEQLDAGLTRRAARFFNQDIFKGIDGLDDQGIDDDSGIDIDDSSKSPPTEKPTAATSPKNLESAHQPQKHSPTADADSNSESDGDFEIVKRDRSEDEEDWTEGPSTSKSDIKGRPNIEIITAEAMTLAHQLATGQKTKADMLDDNFNKYSHRDVDGLPDWFLDDENRHSRPHRPITAEAARAIKEKLRALNARPIKKVREAKERKKFKAAQRLEKLRKKAGLAADEEGVSEGDKARNVAKLMARAAKKKPKKSVKVVVAKGGNRGISGRPKGTKGKYKMVDKRLKKDVRAEKRLAKKR
ncbi:MAG: AdoMet-dependent rRNA methyltransferase spb1 [Bogoriella megaspora]|nr:MAG: AdoMet-dependent rRNA methyltransferase spb1 [Bogoriella megaspora]